MWFHCLQILKGAIFLSEKKHRFYFIKANSQIHKNRVWFFISIIWSFDIQEIQAAFVYLNNLIFVFVFVYLNLMLISDFLTLLTFCFNFSWVIVGFSTHAFSSPADSTFSWLTFFPQCKALCWHLYPCNCLSIWPVLFSDHFLQDWYISLDI